MAAGAILVVFGCTGSPSAPPAVRPVKPAGPPPSAAHGDAGSQPSRDATPTRAPPEPECPPEMVHVKTRFCPEVRRRCLDSEYDRSNHITLCHRFEEGTTECVAERVALDFCIDRYEFPNEKGGHPPVMVDWYEAMGKCAAQDKRLCYEGEWTAACEGPDETPFPSGWERSAERCNIDNRWISPSLKKIYSKDPAVRDPELARLDQSVPSGSKPECVSGYGVYDLTGNFDEWTLADHDRPKKAAVFAALKGGAWGHVRNACRPVTTSHRPEFRYYFVSFRCCKDPRSMEAFQPDSSHRERDASAP